MIVSKDTKTYIQLLISVDMVVGSLSYLKGFNWFVSSQVGFFTTILVTISSFYSYRSFVKRGSLNRDLVLMHRDKLDKVDDEFDLYDNDSNNSRVDRNLKERVKNFKNTLPIYLSPLRVVAYLIFLLGFFYLDNNQLLNIFGYLLGISVIPLSSILLSIKLLF
jgi:hypothetical protein